MPDAEVYFEVGPLSCEEGEEMLEMLLASDTRKAYFCQSFPSGGQALLFKLAFHEARKWASSTSPSELLIASTAQDTMHTMSVQETGKVTWHSPCGSCAWLYCFLTVSTAVSLAEQPILSAVHREYV